MIPFRDNIPSRRTPLLTIALIALNAAVFLAEAAMPEQSREAMVFRFGVVPREFAIIGNGAEVVEVERQRLVRTPQGVQIVEEVRKYTLEGTVAGAAMPLVTSMFLHGGWMHLIGNMWFLWLFGDNVEDRLGRWRYLVLYLLSGLAAAAMHVAFNWNNTAPVIGASGAVAGVLGAYFITYPYARVQTLVPFFKLFWSVVELPGFVFLGFWVLMQFFQGAAAALLEWAQLGKHWFLMQFFQGAATLSGVSTESVVWWAHIGGFVVGGVLMKSLASELPGRRGPTWTELREPDDEPT